MENSKVVNFEVDGISFRRTFTEDEFEKVFGFRIVKTKENIETSVSHEDEEVWIPECSQDDKDIPKSTQSNDEKIIISCNYQGSGKFKTYQIIGDVKSKKHSSYITGYEYMSDRINNILVGKSCDDFFNYYLSRLDNLNITSEERSVKQKKILKDMTEHFRCCH